MYHWGGRIRTIWFPSVTHVQVHFYRPLNRPIHGSLQSNYRPVRESLLDSSGPGTNVRDEIHGQVSLFHLVSDWDQAVLPSGFRITSQDSGRAKGLYRIWEDKMPFDTSAEVDTGRIARRTQTYRRRWSYREDRFGSEWGRYRGSVCLIRLRPTLWVNARLRIRVTRLGREKTRNCRT